MFAKPQAPAMRVVVRRRPVTPEAVENMLNAPGDGPEEVVAVRNAADERGGPAPVNPPEIVENQAHP